MKKYPYSFEEFKNGVEKQYYKKYCFNDNEYFNEHITNPQVVEIIENDYQTKKELYETGKKAIEDTLNWETNSTVYDISLF